MPSGVIALVGFKVNTHESPFRIWIRTIEANTIRVPMVRYASDHIAIF
jgi:hypothetical protein